MNTKTRRNILAAAALLAALPLAAFQGGPPAERRLEFLSGYLSLSDTQQAQARAIFAAANTASETLRGTFESARTPLTAAIKANASDAEIDRLAAALGTIEGQLAAVRAKAEAKFYALLTTEQKTKYDAVSTHGPGARGPGARGMGGRGPGGPR